MEPIHVPRPPSQAFNKNRRISDLIRAQVNHLKHVEHKLPADLRQQIPQHAIVTEQDAARYIAPMTILLRREVPTVASTPVQARTGMTQPVLISSQRGLELAASDDGGKLASKSKRSVSKEERSNPKTAKPTRKGKK